MGEVMTLEEINKRCPGEWVLVGDPETDEALQVMRGSVLWHSRNRDEVYSKAAELRPKFSAVLYTGSIPAGTVVLI